MLLKNVYNDFIDSAHTSLITSRKFHGSCTATGKKVSSALIIESAANAY